MAGKDCLRLVRLEAVIQGGTCCFAPEALGPKGTPQVAAEFEDAVPGIAGMQAAAANVFTGFAQEQRPILKLPLSLCRDFEGESVLDLGQ